MNIPIEINLLTSRIAYEKQLYSQIANKNFLEIRDEREISTYMSYVNSFRQTMTSNLKYSANDKTVVPPPPTEALPPGEAHITKNETDNSEMEDKRLQSWLDSQESRSEKYTKDLADFQKSANSGDLKASKYSYRNMVQTMMDEVNSNNWLLGQINSGAMNLTGFDATSFSTKIANQTQLLSEAKSIKVSTEDDLKANKTAALTVVEKFGNTLK